jgi:Icc-related predicted phosphoesterase
LTHKHKIVISGNHERIPTIVKYYLPSATHYLRDETCIVNNLQIYGGVFKSKFTLLGNDKIRKKKWDDIPENTDIVITHTPPKGKRSNGHLEKRVHKICPVVHVFGHVHEYYGYYYENDITFICAASKINKNMVNDPIVFDIYSKNL